MSTRSITVRQLITSHVIGACVIGGAAQLAFAGPHDIRTDFPVGVVIGGTEIQGIADGGGTTTISFEDAKALGILDANGDPVNPPDGSTSLSGTGGGGVSCHRYDNLKIKVQPKKSDGSNNGPPREITCTVLIPKKPDSQTGADDAAKQKKTKSVTTKLGKNVTGANIDGQKLDGYDIATADPETNKRGTRWIPAPTEADDRAEVPMNEDETGNGATMLPTVILNGVPTSAIVTEVAVSLIPEWRANQLGGQWVGMQELTVQQQQALFVEGLWPQLPEQNSIPVPIVLIDVVIPTIDHGPIQHTMRVEFVSTPFIQQTVVGGNGLVPPGWAATFNSDENLIQYARLCDADVDESSFVDFDDFNWFMGEFEAGSENADFDRSGFVDFDDFNAFVQRFELGC